MPGWMHRMSIIVGVRAIIYTRRVIAREAAGSVPRDPVNCVDVFTPHFHEPWPALACISASEDVKSRSFILE